MQNKEITFGSEGRKKIKVGIDRAATAVAPTLGAVGMAAMISIPGLDPVECDDGVTILNHLNFKDEYENLGLQKLRKAALRTSAEAGDGTATTTVLTKALVNEAFKEIEEDSSRIREVRERLTAGLEEALKLLSAIKQDVKEEDIERIANISSLDPEVAKLVAEIIKEVGVKGIVTVEKGSQIGYTKEVVKGARFDIKGLISQYFINNPEEGTTVLEAPYIVLVDRKISLGTQIKTLMDSIANTGNKSVLFIADDIDGLGLTSLIQSSKTVTIFDPNTKTTKTGTYDIGAIRNPYTASQSKDFLQDMACLTGATVISEQAGMMLDYADVKLCGSAEKVIITKDHCTIIGSQPSADLETRIKTIENAIEASTSEYEKAMLNERLACLTGGIGVVRIGAYTDTDYNAKKYKVDNAINSTQAALQEGILPGGGTALLRAALSHSEPMFKNALVASYDQQFKNAGMTEKDVIRDVDAGWGFNFKTKEIVNMFDAGIIDPFKVVRLALESATAIAISLVSIETVIVEEHDEKPQ